MVLAADTTAGSAQEGRRYPSPLVKQDLAKLGKDAETRRCALGSIRAVVEEHLQGPALGRFLHQLEDSAEGRRHAAAIIIDLARVHGNRLCPHIPRLLQILVHTLLASAAQPALQSECAKAVVAIAKHAIAFSPSSAELVLKRLCLPLIALLPYKVELLSAGAAACLAALVQSGTWKYAPSTLVSKLCFKTSMGLSSKAAQTVPHLNLLRALASANPNALAQFNIPLLRLVNQEILLCPSTSWQLRVAAIQLVELLFKVSENAAFGSQLGSLLATLTKCRLDKMPHIRKAAISALRAADALTVKADEKQKLIEDLPPVHSQTEPNSPLLHSLDVFDNIEDLIKGNLSPPASQRPQVLFISPRALTELAMNSSSGKQQDSQTPPSDYLTGQATTDDSDYFCAYFFDTKENVSCRKIVHHIHDAVTGSATPLSSPLRSSQKVVVPSLPISTAVHHGSVDKTPKEYHNRSAISTPPSVTRHVAVLDSNAGLAASCDGSLVLSATTASDATQQEPSLSNTLEMKEWGIHATLENRDDKLEATLNVDFNSISLECGSEHVSLDNQHVHPVDDLQAFPNQLLQIKEGDEEEDNEDEEDDEKTDYDDNNYDDDDDDDDDEEDDDVCSKQDTWEDQSGNLPEHQERLEDVTGEEDLRRVSAFASDSDSGDRPLEEGKDSKQDCSDTEVSSIHKIEEHRPDEDKKETVEASNREWSICHNPIANPQICQTMSETSLDAKEKAAEDFAVSSASTPYSSSHICDTDSERLVTDVDSSQQGELDEFEEIEELQTESGEEEVFEGDDDCKTETPRSLRFVDPVEINEPCTTASHDDCQKIAGSKLRKFLIGSSACVIPIAMVTIARLFYFEFLPYEASVSDTFMPPT